MIVFPHSHALIRAAWQRRVGPAQVATSSRLQQHRRHVASSTAEQSASATPVPQHDDVQQPASSSSTATSSAAASSSSGASSSREPNRILMFCAALNATDTHAWPFWKWQQLKATKGVTDLVMLAVTKDQSFVGRISGKESSMQQITWPKRRMKANGLPRVDAGLLKSFCEEYYKPNQTYFVYGGHGMGDYLDLEWDQQLIHGQQLAAAFGSQKYLGIVFDACFMGNLDMVYQLRNNTQYIGACEGYMWEEDTWHVNHVVNPYVASAMCRYKHPGRVMSLVQDEFTRKSDKADFAVYDTTHVEALWNKVNEDEMTKSIFSRIRLAPRPDDCSPDAADADATAISTPAAASDASSSSLPVQPAGSSEGRSQGAAAVDDAVERMDCNDGGSPSSESTTGDDGEAEECSASPRKDVEGGGKSGRSSPTKKPQPWLEPAMLKRVANASLPRYRDQFIFPFSIYPTEPEDNHVCDLYSLIKHDLHAAELFHRVVTSHRPPRDQQLYATPLHGLNYSFKPFNRPSTKSAATLQLPAWSIAAHVVAASAEWTKATHAAVATGQRPPAAFDEIRSGHPAAAAAVVASTLESSHRRHHQCLADDSAAIDLPLAGHATSVSGPAAAANLPCLAPALLVAPPHMMMFHEVAAPFAFAKPAAGVSGEVSAHPERPAVVPTVA